MCVCVCAAYKVMVKSSAAEGDFMTSTATVVEVLKNSDKGQLHLSAVHVIPPSCVGGGPPPLMTSCRRCLAEFAAVGPGTQVELVKKATCTSVEIQNNHQYLVMGSSGSEITLERSFRWVLLLFLLVPPPPTPSFLPPSLCSSSYSSPSPAVLSPGIGSLWTQMRWWSCGLQIVVLLSVRTTFPSWRTLLWTCSC